MSQNINTQGKVLEKYEKNSDGEGKGKNNRPAFVSRGGKNTT